jgi:hypothetical protein
MVSFDLTHLDSRGARLRALRPTVAAHLKSVTVQGEPAERPHSSDAREPRRRMGRCRLGPLLVSIRTAGSQTPPVITIPRWQDGEVTGGARKDATA